MRLKVRAEARPSSLRARTAGPSGHRLTVIMMMAAAALSILTIRI